jgi:hypothetical protein
MASTFSSTRQFAGRSTPPRQVPQTQPLRADRPASA